MALGSVALQGLFSKLDTNSIVEALAAARAKPIELLQERIEARQAALQSYQALSAQMLALMSSASTLASGTAMQARSVTVSEPTAVLATAAAGAPEGTYQLLVQQLAQQHKVSSAAVVDSNAALGYTGDLLLNGRVITLAANDTLATLRDKINAAEAGVTATILTLSAADHRLVLSSRTSGAAGALALQEVGGDLWQRLGLLDSTVSVKHPRENGLASDGFANGLTAIGALLGLSTPPAGTIRLNGVEIAVDLATDSLQDLAARINQSGAGVNAAVVAQTNNGLITYRLELTGETTPTVEDDSGVLETLGFLVRGFPNELQAAQDAVFVLDGYTITRSRNSVDDLIPGVALDLRQADPAKTITLTVTANPQAAASALQQVVSQYNAVMTTLNQGLAWDSETQKGGAFFGDPNILSLQSSLQSLLSLSLNTLGGSLSVLSQIGLTVNRQGQLIFDSATFQQALAENPTGVLRFLTTQAECTHPEVQYVSSGAATQDSGPAGYAVQITQVATKATAQSAALTTLAYDETLTINSRYSITLTAGMTLAEAAEKINWILQSNCVPITASVVEGRLQLQNNFYGASYGFSVSSTLDRGAGGLDLGGAHAGEIQTYYGQNVAGTIGGYRAEGWGQCLTGAEGPVKDLKLLIRSEKAGAKGVVKLSQGWASRLSATVQQAVGTDQGLLAQATQNINNQIADLNAEIARLQDSVKAYKEQLEIRFAAMEAVLAKNQSLMDYLSGQIEGLKGLTTNRRA